MSVWTVSEDELWRLQSRDREFTELVNELLRMSTLGHLPSSTLRLNLKTQAPDGGVDAAVDGAVPASRDAIGLLSVRTCWQFKACPSSHISPQEETLRTEIRKPHARLLIEQGYGYRFCIADSLTPQKRHEWETWLLDEARKIAPDAPAPIVIPADLLADWCSRHAGIVIRVRPYLAAVHDYLNWERRESVQAPTFVPVETRQAATTAIRNFADLSLPVRDPVLAVSGEAGIGKTRCVLETLRSLPGVTALVVATDDERVAVDVIHRLVNDTAIRALFIVDGMDVVTRTTLGRLLAADAHRIRVIAIDNERCEEAAAEGEIRLGPLGQQDLERVLGANYPHVSNEIRWAIAGLANGFVRLAVDICRHLHLLSARGDLSALVPMIRDQYLAARLNGEQRAVVELVSLVARVGYRGDVAEQLRALCAAVPAAGLSPERVTALAAELRHAPGFVAIGPRYLYVTPPVVAQTAFRSAWERWIRTDPETFFAALPVDLEDALYRQLRNAGTPEDRRLFIAFHESWLRHLGPDALSSPEVMHRLFHLVEVEPETLLPWLSDLIDSATLPQIGGLDHLPTVVRSLRGWSSARQRLVWLAQGWLRFPEFYAFAERILYRLALTETEDYLNNATGIWCQIYRPLLSGTPIPYADRIAALERRFNEAGSAAEIRLCLRALEGPLTADRSASRDGTPPLISGRVPPDDWLPTTQEDRAIWQATGDLASRLAQHANPNLADAVIDTVIQHGMGLLRRRLNDLAAIVQSRPLSDGRRVAVLELIERFLHLHCRPDRRIASEELEAQVRSWQRQLSPSAFRDRLRTSLRRAHRLRSSNDDLGAAELSSLAAELLAHPDLLPGELPWLYSAEARNAFVLGSYLGRGDAEGRLLDTLADSALGCPNTDLLRGYIFGLVDRHPVQIARVSALLDHLTPTHPDLVFQLLTIRCHSLAPLERVLRLVDAGRIPVARLQDVWQLVGNRPLTWAELTAVVTRMLGAAERGDADAARGAVGVLTMHLYASQREERTVFDDSVLPLVVSVLETSLRPGLCGEEWDWGELLGELGRRNPTQAIRLAVAAMGSENTVALSQATEGFLLEVAPQHPDRVMAELGAGLLAPQTGYRIRIHELTPVLLAMPAEVVRGWVEQNGLDGARAIARLLPTPTLQNSVPTIPELTAFVMDRFGDNEAVFREFCSGLGGSRARCGDIAADYDQDAALARAFRTHPSRWVRQWASYSEGHAQSSADWFRADDEEFTAP